MTKIQYVKGILEWTAEVKELVNAKNELKELQKHGVNVGNRLQKVEQRFKGMKVASKGATRALSRFKMEMLSVMFFGMAMAKMFGGLLKPAAQVVGLFDLWTATLQVFFLPIMLQLLELFLPFMNALLEMDPGLQKAIGAFVVFGFILGKILFFFGTMALGIAGLIKVFAGTGIISAIWTGLGAIFTVTGAIVVAIIIAIIAVVYSMKDAWDTNFLGMKATVANVIDGIKLIFGGLWNFISGIIGFIVGLFTGNGDMIVESLKKVALGLGQFLLGTVVFLSSALAAIVTGLFRLIWNITKGIKDAIMSVINWLLDKMGSVGDGIRKIASFLNPLKNVPWGKGKDAKSSKAQGGYIPHTGLYKMHAGETVNQSNSSFSPNITINASSGMDIDRLKTQLSTQWNEELTGMSRR